MVLRQGLTGQQLQQVLRLGTTKQFGPSPLGCQLGQQKSRESILFRLREFRRLAEGPLQKLVHPHPSLCQSSRSPGTGETGPRPSTAELVARTIARSTSAVNNHGCLHDVSVTPARRFRRRRRACGTGRRRSGSRCTKPAQRIKWRRRSTLQVTWSVSTGLGTSSLGTQAGSSSQAMVATSHSTRDQAKWSARRSRSTGQRICVGLSGLRGLTRRWRQGNLCLLARYAAGRRLWRDDGNGANRHCCDRYG